MLLLLAALISIACDGTPETGGIEGPASDSAADTVALNDVGEVTLHADEDYDARGTPNPFTEVELSATVRAPRGRTFTVQGFFDGDGRGGLVGDVWKLRFLVDEDGTWRWSVSSNVSSLDGESGEVQVIPGGGGGAFEVDPDHPAHLRRTGGEHEYLVGDWLVAISSGSGKVPLNHNAPSLSDAERADLIRFHTERELTLYSLYLQNAGDLGHRIDPFLEDDRRRYDLRRWHSWEEELDALEAEGLTPELWLSSDEPFDMSDKEFEAFVSYAYARLGARRALWVLGLEVDEYWSEKQRDAFGTHYQEIDAFDRPLGVHFVPGPNEDRDEEWLDYVPLQYGFSTAPGEVAAATVIHREASKPVYAAEFARWDTDDEAARLNLWTSFMSGAALLGNGPGRETDSTNDDFRHFAAYVNGSVAPGGRPSWWRMSPADTLVVSGTGFVLREAGVRWVAYLPFGGAVTLDLSEVGGELTYDWYDPRTGSVVEGGTATAGADRVFTAPDARDWILDVRG